MKSLLLLTCLTLGYFCVVAGPRKPTIKGQVELSTQEEQSITLDLLDLYVEDNDDFYPFGFTMTVYAGTDYTFNNLTVTPVTNFTGTLLVNVTVNDGDKESDVYQVKITVTPINDAPVITGQASLATIEDSTITIKLNDLQVTDPDNAYPTGFSMTLQNGAGYSLSGNTVTPNAGFIGTLSVPVSVSDGMASSAVYTLQIVVNPKNKKPVITGQTEIVSVKNTSFTISLDNLKVDDPDNAYPADFTMTISPGSNYTLSGNTITPATNFVGTLTIKVTVNDGHTTSDPYNLTATIKDELSITGQNEVTANEDEKFSLSLSQLVVYDPANKFPSGYSLVVAAGQHYTFAGSEITPEENYSGPLSISVKVTDGKISSASFNLQVTVLPVNDPPEIIDFITQPIQYTIESGEIKFYPALQIQDPDDAELILAEIGFSFGYEMGSDILSYPDGPSTVHGVFDPQTGVLSLIGQASHQDYALALQNITYNYITTETSNPQRKSVYLKLNDGKTASILYERQITAEESFDLDIPTAFSPNADRANDTWKVRPLQWSERYRATTVRVYNERGQTIFESIGFSREWDGTLHGQPLPNGNYLFTIDLNLNYETERISGSVAILR